VQIKLAKITALAGSINCNLGFTYAMLDGGFVDYVGNMIINILTRQKEC
jgi:hypothetical protein